MFLIQFVLKGWDLWFVIALIAIIVICVAIYFLMPVFKHKQLQEQRDNLRRREQILKANSNSTVSKDLMEEENVEVISQDAMFEEDAIKSEIIEEEKNEE